MLAACTGPALSAPQYRTAINFACFNATPTTAHPCNLNWLTPDPTGTFFYGEGNNCGPSGSSVLVKLQPPAAGKSSWSYTTLYENRSGFPYPDGALFTGGVAVDGSSGALYGVTQEGGLYNEDNRIRFGTGVLFKLTPNGANYANYTYSVLHNFNGFNGSGPFAGPVLDQAGNLVGGTPYGGFGFSPARTNQTGSGVVYTFAPAAHGQWPEKLLSRFPNPTRGETPMGRLLNDASGHLFGVTSSGGAYGAGTVYMVDPTARGGLGERSVIYHFRGTGQIPGTKRKFQDGSMPEAGLIADAAGNLYGTTVGGGAGASANEIGGTVYMLSRDISGTWKETILHNFAGAPNDGGDPASELVLAEGVLYGIAINGGPEIPQAGVIFSLTPPSNGKTAWTYNIVHFFDGAAEGIAQASPLVSDAKGTLYGLTRGPTGQCPQMFELTP